MHYVRARMRALAHAAVIQLLLAGAASTDRQSVTFKGVQIDLDASQPLALTRIVRGAYYFDLDCTDSIDPYKLCAESDSSDHESLLGGEVEVRLGLSFRDKRRRLAYYGGCATSRPGPAIASITAGWCPPA